MLPPSCDKAGDENMGIMNFDCPCVQHFPRQDLKLLGSNRKSSWSKLRSPPSVGKQRPGEMFASKKQVLKGLQVESSHNACQVDQALLTFIDG